MIQAEGSTLQAMAAAAARAALKRSAVRSPSRESLPHDRGTNEFIHELKLRLF
jgi:hypothetical protein